MIHEGAHRGVRPIHLATTTRTATDVRRAVIIASAVLLLAGTAVTLWPFVAALILSAWAAHLSRPVFVRFRTALRGRERAAGLLTAVFVVLAMTPLVVGVIALVPAARSLLDQLKAAPGGKGVLSALVSSGAPLSTDGRGIVALAKEYGAGASRVVALLATASVEAVLGAFVFFAVFYALLVEGDRWWSWAREYAPLDPSVLERIRTAFHEAGRGLILGFGLTALIQGSVATIIYAAFGVPRALLLGMLSVLAALVPMTGPMLVWVPVSLGLGLTGQWGKAIGVAVLSTAIVGTIDNVVRPWLSRRFHVGMPATIVLVTMLGGIIVFGGWGLFLGPLVVRLTGEMLRISRERRLFGGPPAPAAG